MKTGLTRLAQGGAAMVSVTLSPSSGSGQALSKRDNNFPAVRGVFHLGLFAMIGLPSPLAGEACPERSRRGGALRRVRGIPKVPPASRRHASGTLAVQIMTAFALILFLASPAFSATINVTANATDALNGADGQCSLREAITNINNSATTYADCAPTGAAYGTVTR